jgi:hypothetical protein
VKARHQTGHILAGTEKGANFLTDVIECKANEANSLNLQMAKDLLDIVQKCFALYLDQNVSGNARGAYVFVRFTG